MGGRWNPNGFQFLCFLPLIIALLIQGSWSLNDEGIILLKFRARVSSDPFGVLDNWNPYDEDPCLWSRVYCVAGKVQRLDLNGLQLEGTLAPDLGKLSHLKSLVLRKNCFYGAIPKEIRGLTMLELLDLRDNNFSGTVPVEIQRLPSLKCLFKLGMDSRYECGENCFKNLASSSELQKFQNIEILANSARRRLFEQSSNLPAAPVRGESSSSQIIALPTSRSSGSYPAIPNTKKNHSPPPVTVASPAESPPTGLLTASGNSKNETSGKRWIYFLIIPVVSALVIVAVGLLFIFRKRGVTTIGPWKTGLSGQLQKAFVTGVPKLNRAELETACEDFSNIIDTREGCIMYKGTLSSGVEIAVASTLVASSKDWPKNAEISYRKKIDILSRINHKNFVNLIGYCEEDEPFNRMMVFEYAPNGTLFEHLHVKEMEHLDWSMRMRIIMGSAYCLQYMHHDLNPPVAHSNLNSHYIYLTDDYAAKIGEVSFLPPRASRLKISDDGESEHSVLPPLADTETNVYSFGILLLEIISGKLPYSKEQGPLEKWAAEYLNGTRTISYMIDPTLKSFKNNELDVICEVIQECIQPDPRRRPTMREITSKLKEVIAISPDQATPRLSPLWWAELEILSVEAT